MRVWELSGEEEFVNEVCEVAVYAAEWWKWFSLSLSHSLCDPTCSLGRALADTVTVAPSAPKARAVTLPMPADPPVTSTRLPSILQDLTWQG